MGLNPRGRGRGKGRRGGGMAGPGPMFRGPPGMYGPPPMGFPPGPPPFGPPFFGGPCGSNFGPRRPPGYGKFPRKTFKGRPQQKSNNAQVAEIDLTRPWVTDEIKQEDAKKQEYLEIWRKSKDDTDWSKYKEQKLIVQTMYDKAKTEYLASKPEEAYRWRWMEKTEESHHCDACDKSFTDERALYLHTSEHEVCGRDGCQYSAHPKLVAKHVKIQHDTGLYKRIGKLNTKEDIAKWVEERKRRYPTRKVVEEKKALEEDKKKRGERIKEDESKFNKSFSKKRSRSRKVRSYQRKPTRERKMKMQKRREVRDEEMTVEEALKEESVWRGSVPPFCGIRALEDPSVEVNAETDKEEDSRFSDDEWDNPITAAADKENSKEIKSVNSSLGIIASFYDSDEYEQTTQGQEVPPTPEKPASGDENAPEEVKTISVKEPEIVGRETKDETAVERKRPFRNSRRGNRRKVEESNQNSGEVPKVRRREPTLLEKLLSKEIRHERNVILQCVRYVVDNKFFLDS